VVVVTAASANAPAATPANLSDEVRALMRVYLECDRLSTTRLLGFAEAAACSQAAERLLKIGFGGDFNGLLAWWRSEKAARVLAIDAP
jgi:hypothetical protein